MRIITSQEYARQTGGPRFIHITKRKLEDDGFWFIGCEVKKGVRQTIREIVEAAGRRGNYDLVVYESIHGKDGQFRIWMYGRREQADDDGTMSEI